MYGKKILAVFATVAVVAVSAAMFAAFEAHVINVTAHIENALYVHPDELEFGTVFPQEYVTKDFDIQTSESFQGESDALAVSYVIKQKPKCWNNNPKDPKYAPVNYATHACPVIDGVQYVEMLSLCKFLSKNDGDPEDLNDKPHPSYYVDVDPAGPSDRDYCISPDTVRPDATGVLNRNDMLDSWIVDLKVPPVDGTIGQDWPASCAAYTVPQDSQDYGCDLWIEVTGVQRVGQQG